MSLSTVDPCAVVEDEIPGMDFAFSASAPPPLPPAPPPLPPPPLIQRSPLPSPTSTKFKLLPKTPWSLLSLANELAFTTVEPLQVLGKQRLPLLEEDAREVRLGYVVAHLEYSDFDWSTSAAIVKKTGKCLVRDMGCHGIKASSNQKIAFHYRQPKQLVGPLFTYNAISEQHITRLAAQAWGRRMQQEAQLDPVVPSLPHKLRLRPTFEIVIMPRSIQGSPLTFAEESNLTVGTEAEPYFP